MGLRLGDDTPIFACFACANIFQDEEGETTYLDNALDYSFPYAYSQNYKHPEIQGMSAKKESLIEVKWRLKYSLLTDPKPLEDEIAEIREKLKFAKKIKYGWNDRQTKFIRVYYGKETFQEILSELLKYRDRVILNNINITKERMDTENE